jgi:hypothetical protein
MKATTPELLDETKTMGCSQRDMEESLFFFLIFEKLGTKFSLLTEVNLRDWVFCDLIQFPTKPKS